MQHITPNSKRWDYSDIPGGSHGQIKGPAHMVEGGHHPRNRPPTLGTTSVDFYHYPVTVWAYSTPQPNTEVPAPTGREKKVRAHQFTITLIIKDLPTWLKVATTQEIDLQPWTRHQWTSTTTRWRCGLILLPSLTLRSPHPQGEWIKGVPGVLIICVMRIIKVKYISNFVSFVYVFCIHNPTT